jgi:predicted ABC-type ATPase
MRAWFTFVNADLIAGGLSPLKPQLAAIAPGLSCGRSTGSRLSE